MLSGKASWIEQGISHRSKQQLQPDAYLSSLLNLFLQFFWIKRLLVKFQLEDAAVVERYNSPVFYYPSQAVYLVLQKQW